MENWFFCFYELYNGIFLVLLILFIDLILFLFDLNLLFFKDTG